MERNEQIVALWRQGKSGVEIGRLVGLTRARIYQILHALGVETPRRFVSVERTCPTCGKPWVTRPSKKAVHCGAKCAALAIRASTDERFVPIVQEVKDGAYLSDLSERYGVSASAISNHLRLRGIVGRCRLRGPKPSEAERKARDAKILELRKKGLSYAQVAEEVGLKPYQHGLIIKATRSLRQDLRASE